MGNRHKLHIDYELGIEAGTLKIPLGDALLRHYSNSLMKHGAIRAYVDVLTHIVADLKEMESKQS